MNYYFSESELGFYCDEVNESIPADAVEISEELYFSLLEGQSTGKVIAANKAGIPILTDPPEQTVEELVALAEETKAVLMTETNARILPLQDAFDLGLETEEEKQLLLAWKKYRVLLSRVNTETAPDIEWPEKPA
ncbi:tail fiber assembly protein [Enterobacter hormaechei]|uniref:tail fiber assembly protein n=1 Tax=Enterobacter hormaechei TaxID=158836 RepID=UPI0005F01077|nr:tail fiber assembly protein [Enterobacter hormaechei]ELU0836812.1 tail fiber assembly protein [Enterobacter kobei]KJP43097.1 tail assembly protein [Enterobacter hormaechei subsp. xiangfangensis]HCM9162312.1 tail fiber assembly protein [Enterobacter hormaechei subsp. xiangfangensis]HCM9236314.1 tail fiber assembly protein [Enterobacter hormaechei subsp. xiangfangensis]HCM9451947.1 tail fiber assembly protein [Enterobacter hormaechei subsp. xiangfangensis]